MFFSASTLKNIWVIVAGMAVIVSSLVIYFRGETIVQRWRLRRH